jgi:chromosome segregation ATPase
MAFRRLKRRKDEEELELVEEEVMIEEADDEYVLLKAFTSKNPEVAFSYAINRIDELKVDVSALTREKESLEQLNTALQDDIEDAFRFKEQIDDLKDELVEKERELSNKAVEIDTLVRKSAKLGVERDEFKDKIGKKEKQIQGYLAQMEKLKHSDRLIRLEKDNKMKESKLADLEEEAKTLRVQNEEMKDTLSVIDEELNQYKQMAIAQDEELNTLKANWWTANTQVKDVKRQLEEKEGMIASKEEVIKNLMVKSKKINLESDVTNKELEEKKNAISDLEKRIEEAEELKKRLIKENSEKDHKILYLEEKVTEALEEGPKLKEAERHLEELAPLEDEVKKLRISLEEQKDILNVATSEASQYKQMAASMDQELNSIKASWWETNKQIKSLKEEIEVKEGIIQAKDATLNELIEKSRGMTAELDMLKKQMADSAMMGGGTAAAAAPTVEAPTPASEPTPAPEPASKVEEQAAPRAEEPAPKVNPNASKIKLLEIEKRSLLKMLGNPKIQGGPLEKKYIEKLDEINKKLRELSV